MPFLPFIDSGMVIHQQQFVYLSSTSVGLVKDDSTMLMYISENRKALIVLEKPQKILSVLFKHLYSN
jgi:hypothetical protein